MTVPVAHILPVVILAGGFIFYACHVVLFTRGWFRLKGLAFKVTEEKLPTVSVIIPMRNEGKQVGRLVRQYLEQDYPARLSELILVDDHSTDDTADHAMMLVRKNSGSGIRLISLEKEQVPGSKKNALTTGVNKSKGELILTTDADCTPGKEWIKTMAFSYCRQRKKFLSGPVVIKGTRRTFFSCFEEFEFSSLVASGAGAIGIGRPIFSNGANMAYEKNAFLAVGGYEGNEKFASGDDVFLLHKIKRKFGPHEIGFVRDPSAIVSTVQAPGMGSYIRQRVRWGAKSRGYKDLMAFSTAWAVVSFNLALLGVLVYSGVQVVMAGNASLSLLSVLIACFLKCLVDLPLMWGMASFIHRRKLLWGYPFYQLIYPFYILTVIMGILFSRPVWKGRKIS